MFEGEEESWSSSVHKQNTACLGHHSISDKYYRYWYYQNRAWKNSFQIPGKEGETPLKPFFSSYSENKAVIIDSSLRIIKQQKKIASQWLTWWEGKEGAWVAPWLCCFLPATANEIPCQGRTCHTSSTSKGVWRIFYCLWLPRCLVW